MEKKKPELDLPLPDQETFERVWRRVMPNQELSPVAVDTPDRDPVQAEEEHTDGDTQSSQPVPQSQEDAALLLALADQVWEGISRAQTLTHRMGSRARQLSELSADHQRALRQLSALYFLLTGQRVPPRQPIRPREALPLSQALREQYLWEQKWRQTCLLGGRQAHDGELRGLLEELAQDGALHGRAIRGVLERMGPSPTP